MRFQYFKGLEEINRMENPFIILLAAFLCLCACSTNPLAPTENRVAICKELKSKIIFAGNTSNNRAADIENAEMALLQRQYEKYHCDQI